MVAWVSNNGNVAVVGGVRTPFAKAGTALSGTHVTELARTAMQEVLYRTGWPSSRVDEVVMGNVVMPADATNPARVAALYAGIPESVPALTVQRNCASGMEAIGQAAARIQNKQVSAALVAGAESMSTVPLMLPVETLAPMTRLMKAKTPWQKLGAIAGFRPKHFKMVSGLEQGLTDPTCGMIMGKTAEVLAHEFAISRAEQDQFALASHQKATAAIEGGHFEDHMVTVYAGDRCKPVSADIGPRANQTMEALAKLRPIFDRRDGSVTTGNACQITDGAVAELMVDGELARAEGMEVLGYVRGYATAALDPRRMGLGPVFAIDRLLSATGMTLDQIGLIEINEAFAVQVIACLKAMASDAFCQKHLGRSGAIGQVDTDRLNIDGGAIALGHPVGATGARIVLSLLHAMRREGVEYGIASLCVGGGQGTAVLLQRR